MNPTDHINRRTVLRGLGGLGAVAAGGAGLAYYASLPATAAQVNISSVDIELDDGDVHFVDLDLADYFAIWNGFDRRVAAVAFHDVIRRPSTSTSHTLFDQRGVDADPVLLANISSQGDGSDGWGGPGEYASTFDEGTEPDTGVVNRPGVDGPAEATAGWVHADVLWRLLSDHDGDPNDEGYSIEDPGDVDAFGLNNPDDGTTKTVTLEMVKEVYLYRLPDDSETPDLTTIDGTGVVLMGGDDGSEAKVQATPQFTVDVINQASDTNPDGDGETSGG